MTKQFQGRTVTVVRKAKQGDPGFDANKDQTIVNDGGTEKTVETSALTDKA